jgi:hypothetical protein
MNRNPEHIETLLREKDFSQLTEAERELVLTHLSGESEYRNMQRLLSRVRETFQTEAAQLSEDEDMKERVMLRFSQNLPKSEADGGILYACLSLLKRKPILAFAGKLTLMVFLVTASLLFWPNTKPELAIKNSPAEQPETIRIQAETADHTDANAEVITREKAVRTSEIITDPISTVLTDNQAAGEAYDEISNEMPNEVNIPVSAMAREEVSISKSEEDDRVELAPAETTRLMKESKKNTEKLRDEKLMPNQVAGTGKIFAAAPEMQDASPGKGSAAPSYGDEGNSKEAFQKQIKVFLLQKAESEGKTNFLNAYRGQTLVLTVTFQPDGIGKKIVISGVTDKAGENWIISKLAEMPGLHPPKDKQQERYHIRF